MTTLTEAYDEKTRLYLAIDRIAAHIIDLSFETTYTSAKFQHILAAQQNILHRWYADNEESFTDEQLDDIAVFDLLGMMLLADAIDERLSNREADVRDRITNNRTRAALRNALSTFEKVLGQRRLSPLKTPKELPLKIWRLINCANDAQAQEDAAKILAFFRKDAN